MTIKKLFFILSSIIIAIPLFIISIVLFQKYLNKPERLLINGTEKITKFKTRDISKKDKKALMEILKILPPEVVFSLNQAEKLYSQIFLILKSQ